MKRYFITFADSRLYPSLSRLKNQAEGMGCFDVIRVLTEKQLDKDFCNKYKHLLKVGVRGFGYWIWKPYIIQKTLQEMNEGDQLLYLDAGCHLNYDGKKRLFEYFEEVASSDLKVGGFQIEEAHNEKRWSKMDLVAELGVSQNEEILNSGQICATRVILQKSKLSVAFVNEWMKFVDNIHYIDDSPSSLPNFPDFVEHRHDQSVFSILCKIHGAVVFNGCEVYPHDGVSWHKMNDYPIHDKRDKKLSSICMIGNKISCYVKKLKCKLFKISGNK